MQGVATGSDDAPAAPWRSREPPGRSCSGRCSRAGSGAAAAATGAPLAAAAAFLGEVVATWGRCRRCSTTCSIDSVRLSLGGAAEVAAGPAACRPRSSALTRAASQSNSTWEV
jgi:hypothetical protein